MRNIKKKKIEMHRRHRPNLTICDYFITHSSVSSISRNNPGFHLQYEQVIYLFFQTLTTIFVSVYIMDKLHVIFLKEIIKINHFNIMYNKKKKNQKYYTEEK